MEYQCLPNCRYVPCTSQNRTNQRPVLFCALVGFTTNALRSAEVILLSKEAEIVDDAQASAHMALFYDVFNMSPSFRPRARGKLCSRGFIFSSSLQHTVRSEFPSWWRYKYKNTKWTYLWDDNIQILLQKWIKESYVWHLTRKYRHHSAVQRKRGYSEGFTSCLLCNAKIIILVQWYLG